MGGATEAAPPIFNSPLHSAQRAAQSASRISIPGHFVTKRAKLTASVEDFRETFLPLPVAIAARATRGSARRRPNRCRTVTSRLSLRVAQETQNETEKAKSQTHQDDSEGASRQTRAQAGIDFRSPYDAAERAAKKNETLSF